jgi:hypothetical protein
MTKIKNRLTIIYLLFIEILIVLPQSRYDPNLHHDGVIFTAAVAIENGLIPNKDIFAQYGPGAPLIQGFWLKFMGAQLVNLRVLTAFLLILTGLLLFLVLEKHLNKKLAFIICLVWCLTYPNYILPPNLPWPSVITTFLLMIVVYILTFQYNQSDSGINQLFLVGFISFLLFTAIFVRIHIAFTFFLLTVVLSIRSKKTLQFKQEFRAWIAGLMLSFFTIFLFFLQTKSWLNYFQQAILWAASFFGTPKRLNDENTIVDFSLLLMFPGFLALLLLLLKFMTVTNNSITSFSFMILSSIMIASYSLYKIDVQDKSYLNPKFVLLALSQNFFSIFGYSSALFILFIVFRFIHKRDLTSNSLIIPILAFSSLIQLYPSHDPLHLWWITPLLLSGVAPFVNDKFTRIKVIEEKLFIISCGICIASFLLLFNYLSIDRISSNSANLKHMVGVKSVIVPMDKFISEIEKIPEKARVISKCTDALFSISKGKYLYSDLNYYEFSFSNLTSFEDGDYVIYCKQTEQDLTDILHNDNFEVKNVTVFSTDHINIIAKFQ